MHASPAYSSHESSYLVLSAQLDSTYNYNLHCTDYGIIACSGSNNFFLFNESENMFKPFKRINKYLPENGEMVNINGFGQGGVFCMSCFHKLYTQWKTSHGIPDCEESDEDDTKKRGNMYWDTLQYHCYNCSHHTNLHTFLKDHQVRMPNSGDSFTNIDYIKANKTQVSQEQVLQNASLASVQEKALTVAEFKQIFGAKEIEPGDWIWFQLKDRLLHNKADEFLFSPKGNRLWILNKGMEGKINLNDSISMRIKLLRAHRDHLAPLVVRLKEKSLSFFSDSGFKIIQSEKERNYFGIIENKPNIKIIFLV